MNRVPEGWAATTLHGYIDVLSGFPFRSVGYTTHEEDIKLLRGDNIEPNRLRWRDVKRWVKADFDSFLKYQLAVGDFIIAMDRTWVSAGLKVAEVKAIDLPCLLVQRVARIRALPGLEQSLVKYLLSGNKFEQYVKSVQTETAVPHISSKQIKDFPVLIPSLIEQQKIAQILSTWDQAITTTEQLLANSQQQKKALMQQLLTGAKGSDTKEEWRFGTFSDLFEVVNDKSKQIKSSDYLEVGRFPIVDQSQQDIAGFSDRQDPYINVPVIIFGDHTRCLKWVDYSFFLGADGTQVLKTKNPVGIKYGYFLLLNTHIPNLGYSRHMSVLKEKDFQYPQSKVKQKSIVTILNSADQEISLLKKKLEFLKDEKQALMQQLLTGKRRVTA